jgi:hypothetical protein
MNDQSTTDTARTIVVNVISAAGGQLIGGPEGVFASAAAQPVLDQAGRAVQRLVERVPARVRKLLGVAAHDAGVSITVLCKTLENARGGEDLLLKTIRAAVDSAVDEKLMAYAVSLTKAATGSTITFESQFVAAVAALDEAHFLLLGLFNRPQRELVPAQHLSAVIHIDAINSPAQIMTVDDMREMLPELGGLIEPLVFGLQRYGLVVPWDYQGTSTVKTWEITLFGRECLRRITEIGIWVTTVD